MPSSTPTVDPVEPPKRGALADLKATSRGIPEAGARVVREVAQREYEADVRAHDALLTRANAMLAASGVALSLLVGLSREVTTKSTAQHWLFALALITAGIAVVFVVLCLRVRSAETVMNNNNIVGKSVEEKSSADLWLRDYELALATSYFEVRMNQAKKHKTRAMFLAVAQWVYLVFLILVSVLGCVTIV